MTAGTQVLSASLRQNPEASFPWEPDASARGALGQTLAYASGFQGVVTGEPPIRHWRRTYELVRSAAPDRSVTGEREGKGSRPMCVVVVRAGSILLRDEPQVPVRVGIEAQAVRSRAAQANSAG